MTELSHEPAVPPAARSTWPPAASIWGIAAPGDAQRVNAWLRGHPGAVALPSDDPGAAIVTGERASQALAADGSYLCVAGNAWHPTDQSDPAAEISASALLAAYSTSGLSAFDQLTGLAAIVVWDNPNRTLHLVRHPGGAPAIFYRTEGGSLEWSTRVDALIQSDDQVDYNSAAQFLRIGAVISPATMVQRIRRVPPGDHLSLDSRGKTRGPVWIPDWGPRDSRPTIEEKTLELDRILSQSLQQWLATTSKRPAILMSGGIDSAGLAAAVTRLQGSQLTAYTVTFEDYRGYIDEYEEAHRVARHLEIDHVAIRYGPAFIQDYLDWMVGWYGEPFSYAIHTAQLSEIALADHDLVFGGTGLDNYYPYGSEVRWRGLTRTVPKSLHGHAERLTARLMGLPRTKGIHRAFFLANAPDSETVLRGIGSYAEVNDLIDLVADQANLEAANESTLRYLTDRLGHLQDGDPITNRSYGWAYATDPDHAILWMQAWMGAYRLRPALPYIDPRIPGYLSRLTNLLPDRGEFRALALRSLPRDLAYNRKIGQSVPLAEWFRGPLREFLVDRLSDVSHLGGLLDQASLNRLLRDHLEGRSDNRWLLWKILTLSAWQDRFDFLTRIRSSPQTLSGQVPE